jgi:HK97 family phage prohead protease
MEIKTTVHQIKEISGRTVTGIFAVHGNIDGGGDRSFPGAFAKTFAERSGKIRFLWGHDFFSPPTAKITNLREVGRDELPEGVLAAAPDAMGGAEVTREYLSTPRGDEILEGIKTGAIGEMSYAYDAVKFDFEELGDKRVRNLREVRLYEASDVLWGMNPATQGSKADALIEQIARYMAALKSGARHSSADIELINQIAANAISLGATNVKLLDEQDDGKQQSRAEPVSLTLIAQRLKLFELETVR